MVSAKSSLSRAEITKISCTHICIELHLLSSELDSFFRLTPTCLVISLVVYSLLLCSRLHPRFFDDEVACLKPSSINVQQLSSLICPRLSTHSSTTEDVSHPNLRIQVFPCLSLCILDLEKTVDVFKSIVIWQTHKVVAVHCCHFHILVWNVEQCCAVFASSEALLILHRSSSRNQVARCGKHLEFHTWSWPICQLCLRHTSDDLPQVVWRQLVSGLFLGNVLCWCRWCLNFNGFPLFDHHSTDTMIETSTFTASRGGTAENNWEASRDLCALTLEQSSWTLWSPMYPIEFLHVSRSQHKACLADTHPRLQIQLISLPASWHCCSSQVDIVPEMLGLQSILELHSRVHSTLSLFTKCFRIVAIQFLPQTSCACSFKVVLHGYFDPSICFVKKPVVLTWTY